MADMSVTLAWTGEGLKFDGSNGIAPAIRLDGSGGATGPSPMQALLLALAGCMAADIVDIAAKMRAPMTGLEVAVEGDRAPEPPRRYTRIALVVTVHGAAAEDEPKFQRALDLSRETYCSVTHSLRSDIDLNFQLKLG